MSWRATVLTLFPSMFPGPLGQALAGRAREAGVWSLETLDIRDFARRRDRRVDDTPFGGGAGMVLRADVLDAAIAAAADPDRNSSAKASADGSSFAETDPDRTSAAVAECTDRHSAAKADERPLLYVTPRGQPLAQCDVRALAEGPGVIVLCGRYEGVDQRVIDARALREISVGDYVLSGGELAAMVVLDACVRLLPGVMGAAESAVEESFSAGLLEYPHYTRPAEWQGRMVPNVLLSGDHARIAAWRHNEAETITRARRPDLWAAYNHYQRLGAIDQERTER